MLDADQEMKSALAKDFIKTLILLQNNLRLYEPANMMIQQATKRMLSALAALTAAEDSVTVIVGQHAFIYAGQLIERSSPVFEAFANRLFNHGIAAVTFNRGVTAAQVHVFLQLLGRKPSTSWEEGGVEAALLLRKVDKIVVREMREQDFYLDDDVLEDQEGWVENSPLWQRFALSIMPGLQTDESAASGGAFLPKKLAEAVNLLLEQKGGSDGEALARDMSLFLRSLKQEKTGLSRIAMLNSLVELVNELKPEVRNLFIHNVFNLDVDADLSEGLLRGMSDQVIMDALRNAFVDKGYAPPVVLQLLGRLAAERGLAPMPANIETADSKDHAERIAELFRADEFDKYVPKLYQKALLSIIKSCELPPAVTENLTRLKNTLEVQSVDRHVGDILVQILQGPLELQDVGLLKSNIKETIDCYLVTHNYAGIKELLLLCRREKRWSSIATDIDDYLATPRFSSTLLDNLNRLEREKSDASIDLITEIGTPFIEPLLERLSVEGNRSLRRLYLIILVRLGEVCIPQAVRRLTDSRWFVVRNMLYLLRELGHPGVVKYVRPCIKHPHAKVSQEALKICLIFRDREAVPYLLAQLEGDNEGELIQAVSNAALCDEPAIFGCLVEMLQKSSVMNFRLELKRAIVRSLATSAPKKSLRVFADLLDSSSRLHARQLKALKLEVVAALDKISDEGAKRLLDEEVRRGSAEVMQAAQAALAKYGGGRA